MITAPRWLLLLVGLVLSAHWMPYLAIAARLGLQANWIGSAAESSAVLFGAWLLVEHAGQKADRDGVAAPPRS